MDGTHSSGPHQVDPQSECGSARASLAALLRSFLASEITAFQFDERLDTFRDSDDPVIDHVVDAVWHHYDDCDDHLVCLSRRQWDYFQRLLLVLESDCRMEITSRRRSSWKRLSAAVALGVFVLCAVRLGWGWRLPILSIPFGAVSIALFFWRDDMETNLAPFAPIVYPFASFADLATAWHSSGFRKTRYPRHVGERRIRSPFMEGFWRLQAYTVWLLLSPIALLFQTFPASRAETRFKAV